MREGAKELPSDYYQKGGLRENKKKLEAIDFNDLESNRRMMPKLRREDQEDTARKIFKTEQQIANAGGGSRIEQQMNSQALNRRTAEWETQKKENPLVNATGKAVYRTSAKLPQKKGFWSRLFGRG